MIVRYLSCILMMREKIFFVCSVLCMALPHSVSAQIDETRRIQDSITIARSEQRLSGDTTGLNTLPASFSAFDSTSTFSKLDTPKSSIKKHSAKKAVFFSAVLPGLGQAYNKKYWKIPVIYGLTGVLTYFAVDNNKEYIIYKDAYKWRLDDNSATVDKIEGIYSDEDLRILKNYYRRNRDLSFIGMGVVYLLNVVDAAVDAHLFYFDVSDDLSLKVQPGIQPMRHSAFAGVKLSLQIR